MVLVRAGASKGQKGKVLEILASGLVVVEGVNMRKKSVRSKDAKKKATVIERPTPLHMSNVGLVDPKTGGATRIGYKVEGDKKIRVAKKSGTKI